MTKREKALDTTDVPRELDCIRSFRDKRDEALKDGLYRRPLTWEPCVTPDTPPSDYAAIIARRTDALVAQMPPVPEDVEFVGRLLINDISHEIFAAYRQGLEV